jgi:hypothetical protein
MKKFFKDWLDNWPDPYPQRYRKNFSYKWVEQNGGAVDDADERRSHLPRSQPKPMSPRASAGAARL